MAEKRMLAHILYFHSGFEPTAEQRKEADKLDGIVKFRNRDQVSDMPMSPLEECDGVAGDVPPRYAKAYPAASALGADRLNRMSDLDRKHGPVTSLDNEAARAAKPPAVSESWVTSAGAARPAGAVTVAGGGFVAPTPGNSGNVAGFGSERAENAAPGAPGEGNQGRRANPQALPDAGVALPGGTGDTGAATVPTASGGGQTGFVPPTPVTSDTDTGSKGRRSKGDTGASA